MKNILIAFLLGIICLQALESASNKPANPGLMHMRRKEFIAAGVMQGVVAHYGLSADDDIEAHNIARHVVLYADALMEELNK